MHCMDDRRRANEMQVLTSRESQNNYDWSLLDAIREASRL